MFYHPLRGVVCRSGAHHIPQIHAEYPLTPCFLRSPIMSCNLVFYNSGSLLGEIFAVQQYCWYKWWAMHVWTRRNRRAYHSVTEGDSIGFISGYYRSQELLRHLLYVQALSSVGCLFVWQGCRQRLHACLYVCFFCMCHRSSTPCHWWLVDGVQSRDISVAMTTGKPHPVSYTQPPQHAPFRTKQWKEGPVWWYRRWGLTGAEKNKMNHPTVVDRPKQSII